MLKHWLIKNTQWIIVIFLTIAIEIISFNPFWVEKYYTYGIYQFIAKALRILFGWIPFSLGDILYAAASIWLIYKIVKVAKKIIKRTLSKKKIWCSVKKIVYIVLWIFVLFYGLWGLNYSRVGIAGQLGLNVQQQYKVADLDSLVEILHTRLNDNAALLTTAMRDSFKTKRMLFSNAAHVYDLAEKNYPFLSYKSVSVKPSLFSYLGNYLGFQGYYNPFTGEAQINTTVPQCETPFVATHEIAHQLGYAKENEANFVAFLSCRLHPSVNFKYSVYFDMYHYAIRELVYVDSVKAKNYDSTLHPQVKKDREELIAFYQHYRNPIEPFISSFYSYFLKANNQPKGRESYSEVVIWLIAFYKKYGMDAI